jgi:hypothetical protein
MFLLLLFLRQEKEKKDCKEFAAMLLLALFLR